MYMYVYTCTYMSCVQYSGIPHPTCVTIIYIFLRKDLDTGTEQCSIVVPNVVLSELVSNNDFSTVCVVPVLCLVKLHVCSLCTCVCCVYTYMTCTYNTILRCLLKQRAKLFRFCVL